MYVQKLIPAQHWHTPFPGAKPTLMVSPRVSICVDVENLISADILETSSSQVCVLRGPAKSGSSGSSIREIELCNCVKSGSFGSSLREIKLCNCVKSGTFGDFTRS